jgi:hypothetical protein
VLLQPVTAVVRHPEFRLGPIQFLLSGMRFRSYGPLAQFTRGDPDGRATAFLYAGRPTLLLAPRPARDGVRRAGGTHRLRAVQNGYRRTSIG